MYRIPGDDYIENISIGVERAGMRCKAMQGEGERLSGCEEVDLRSIAVTDTETVAFGTEAKVSEQSEHKCSYITQNIIKSTEDKVISTNFRSFGTGSNKLNCSICFASIRNRRVSCAKCTTQWCVPCYMNLSIANTNIIKCPICRFLSQSTHLNRFRINSLGL